MNKNTINLTTTKIKVKSIDEMLAEMRKLKNSGGEWKLLEKHTKWTLGGGRKSKDSVSGFILSNGAKKVDIVIEKNDYDLVELDTIFGGKEGYQKLGEVFPDNEVPFSNRKRSVGYSYSLKTIGEITKEHTTIMRVFNAWSLNDLFKILVDYYQENKTEIDQSTEKNYNQLNKNEFALSAPWLEVGEDDNLYCIWVGKRDLEKGSYLGGGEWEICLKKSDLAAKYDENGMKLLDPARGPEGVKKLKSVLNGFWVSLTDKYDGKFGNGAEIAHYNTNVQVGFNGDDPVAWLNSKSYEDYEPTENNPNSGSPISSSFNSNPSLDQKKEQIRRYMEQNDISRLTLDNGKLIVEYNRSSKKEEKEISSLEKNIQDYLKKHNNSVSLDQLKTNSNSPATNQNKKPDYTLWIFSGMVAIILALGIFVYWMKKRKNK